MWCNVLRRGFEVAVVAGGVGLAGLSPIREKGWILDQILHYAMVRVCGIMGISGIQGDFKVI
jgi:hypothetical protein